MKTPRNKSAWAVPFKTSRSLGGNLASDSDGTVDPAFLGTGWSFPPSFDSFQSSVVMASGELDVRESLYILLSTSLGERVMLAAYGCDLISKVFTGLTTTVANEIATMVTRAIIEWEPRVSVENVVVGDDIVDGWIAISIDYFIRQTNSRSNLVYPFYELEATLPQLQS